MKINFQHKVMNCNEYDQKKFKPGCVSPKLDGVRGFYYPGEGSLWTRNEKKIYGMEHIVEDLKGMGWPVDMELYVPGMEFNKISGIVRNHEASPEVQGHIIDIICPGDLIDRFMERPTPTSNVFTIPHYKCYTEKTRLEWHRFFLHAEFEGSVWKPIDPEYTNTRRHWLRDVPVKSEDCKVLGVYEGRGKMEGIAGGIIIDFNGLECKCGTMKGLTYEDREDLLDNAEYYIGMTAEIQYKNLQPSGKPRQPRYKGWRHDK